MVEVYWKTGCRPCATTKQVFDSNGIDYTAIEVTDETFNIIHDMGFRQVPVVVTDEDKWSGWNKEMIKKVVEGYN